MKPGDRIEVYEVENPLECFSAGMHVPLFNQYDGTYELENSNGDLIAFYVEEELTPIGALIIKTVK